MEKAQADGAGESGNSMATPSRKKQRHDPPFFGRSCRFPYAAAFSAAFFFPVNFALKASIRFRGREMAHPEQGLNVLERLAEDLKPYATVESKPKMEGRNMLMLLAPIKGAFDEDKAASDTK